jgi:hypothetical protein
LPDIEAFIGHKIPVANYDPTILPELIKPKYKPRKKTGRKGPPRRRR